MYLSRLKSLSGLRLLGFNSQALELDSLAIKVDRRFQELSEEAETHYELMDLTPQHNAFIRHCGGTLNETEICAMKRNCQRWKNQLCDC